MNILKNNITINYLNIIGVFRSGDHEVYHLMKTKKKGNVLKVIFKQEFADLENLETKIESDYPIILLIDGKGVLNKKIDLNQESDLNWYKSIDLSMMHYTRFTENNVQFLSFCRKNIIEEKIDFFQKKKFQIIDFYVGSLTAALLKKSISSNSILSNENIFEFHGDTLIEVLKAENGTEKKYEIMGESLSHHQLSIYGAAVHFYIKQESVVCSESSLLNKDEVLFRDLFNKWGKRMLIVFFTLLLISYTATNFFIGKNNELKESNLNSNFTDNQIEILVNQKDKKIKILNEMGYNSSNFISYYVYELINSVPGEIQLLNLSVFPLKEEVKENKKMAFITNSVLISGLTEDEYILNNWLISVKSMKWINKFEVVSIKKDKKNNTFFEIKILLKNV